MATNVYGAVKQLVRDINGSEIFRVDQELDEWYQLGYRLLSAHVVASSPMGHTILYVLVRA